MTEPEKVRGGWITDPDRVVTVSPSQIEAWLDCPRKWGFSTVENIRTGSAATERGTRVHAQREAWLRDGRPFTLDAADPLEREAAEIALAGIELLPPPGDAIAIESEFHLDAAPGIQWHGFIDLIWYDAEAGILSVEDHKTTSGSYPIKTEDDLRLDPQALIYSAAAFAEFGETRIRNRWHYLRTKKPFRLAGAPTITRRRDDPEFLEALDCLRGITVEIATARRTPLPTINDLPANPRSCGKFGGCPHRESRCEPVNRGHEFSALFNR